MTSTTHSIDHAEPSTTEGGMSGTDNEFSQSDLIEFAQWWEELSQ